MKKPTFDARFLITVVVLLILLSFQALFWVEFRGGGLCMKSLEDVTDSYPQYEGITHGWPLGFVTVAKEGCFDDRKTQIEWNIPSLLVDVLAVGSIAALPYGIPWLWCRSRDQARLAR